MKKHWDKIIFGVVVFSLIFSTIVKHNATTPKAEDFVEIMDVVYLKKVVIEDFKFTESFDFSKPEKVKVIIKKFDDKNNILVIKKIETD